ncbi:MAG: D-alanyl-D-alanine carboxypeptidase/D-alanyl-D-alanine-endopeptidase [Rhodocyclaceae bacterium]|nr:D-alanyl-D-alanine carboxypeptidase/D-alanyl-D-alanine-endopeptidase [Rhodocyclaceae bacterium]MDZ4215803.1 D-alanyl-D-alanine carboxypeptidase/D-alanyl-D-alanine-endopeptidase [Rhodocyclaceae bacterium]
MKHLLLILLALLCLPAHAQDKLPPSVLTALQSAGIPAQAVAVVAQALDNGKPALQHQAQVAMNPASLMKLLTTLVALDTLGPAYTWRTEVLSTAVPENGILPGDLILRGNGDPKFTYDRLWLLLRELRGRGVGKIHGDLLLDRSAFALPEHDPAAFDAKPLRPYNVGADALLFNFATLHLTLVPERNAVRLFAEPLPADFAVVNRLRLTEGRGCGEWREALNAQLTTRQLTLSGDFPRGCGEKRWHLAGLPNALLLHGVFTRLWRELGGEFSGSVRETTTPPNATLLASSESPALGEIVRDINKFSNNVMAQQLYLKVGAGETAQAELVIRNWLIQKGLNFPELILDNGSGLSRRNRIAAASLAKLLDLAWRSAIMPELVASLPIAAIDGTTKKKYNGNGIAGQAHLKTGSLEGVRGIAGYLLDKTGRRHLVVFMVNHPNAAQAQPAFDALLDTLWRGESGVR